MNSSINTLKFSHATPAHRMSTHALPGRLARWGNAVWQTLESMGRARARRELLLLADRWQSTQPELAAQLRAACREPAVV